MRETEFSGGTKVISSPDRLIYLMQGGAQELARRGVDKLGGVPLDGELDCKDEDEEPEAQQMETQDVNTVLKRLEMISKVGMGVHVCARVCVCVCVCFRACTRESNVYFAY